MEITLIITSYLHFGASILEKTLEFPSFFHPWRRIMEKLLQNIDFLHLGASILEKTLEFPSFLHPDRPIMEKSCGYLFGDNG